MRAFLSRNPAPIASLVSFAVAATASFSAATSLQAQSPHPLGANASKYGVAVVDINAIFNRHARLKTEMDGMKQEIQAVDTELKAERERIDQKKQQRDSYNAGSAEYKQLDEELTRMMAEFQIKMNKLQKDFAERRVKIIYRTYLEIVEAVNFYAKRQNIGLVVKFSGDPVDPNRPEDMMQEINKPVIMQDNIDITGDVLQLLNRDQQASRPAQPGSQIPK